MENSFFEFLENHDTDDDDVVEDSGSGVSLMIQRTPHKTVIAESSEESCDDDDEDEDAAVNTSKTQSSADRSSIKGRKSSIIGYRTPGKMRIIESSSEDSDEESPIIKRTPIRRSLKRWSVASVDSPLAVPGKRRMVVRGSDTDDMTPDDELALSAAVRMSIAGVKPADMHSDESDFIDSDNSKSTHSSISDLPSATFGAEHIETDDDLQNGEDNDPNEVISHSTNNSRRRTTRDSVVSTDSVIDDSLSNTDSELKNHKQGSTTSNFTHDSKRSSIGTNNKDSSIGVNINIIDVHEDKNAGEAEGKLSKERNASQGVKDQVIDSDLIVVNGIPEVIDLCSDDDKGQVPAATKTTGRPNTIKQYLVPESYPNSRLVYVTQQARTNALNKLETLRQDLHNVKHIIETLDLSTLMDKGYKLKERLAQLEREVREQGNKVANMVIEPEIPTAEDLANDGFDGVESGNAPAAVGAKAQGLSWADINAAGHSVQPKMFGKQAMSTHTAERDGILCRLRSLHAALASRPGEGAGEAAPQPAALRTRLMQHQAAGLAFLQWRETQDPPGGILADDMGLGKTLTMIALVVSAKESSIDDDVDDDNGNWKSRNTSLTRGGTLVVCPSSLIRQWEQEVKRHCAPHALSVCLHHGARRATRPYQLATYDMVVTSYNIVSRDHDKNGVLSKIRWSRIILDEAHIVRNHKTQTACAVLALEGARRWCLTGTPIQNRDIDVFALIKFLRCTPFDELPIWKKWIDERTCGGQQRLHTLMQGLLLRRTKLQLQDKGELQSLPEKTQHDVEVTLTPAELRVYQKVLVFSKNLFAQFLHQRAERQGGFVGGAAPRPEETESYRKMHQRMVQLQGVKQVKSHEILVLLLRLRQICCHCGLISSMLDAYDKEELGEPEEDPAGLDLLGELQKMNLEDSQMPVTEEEEQASQADGSGGAGEEGTSVAEALRSALSPRNPVFDLSTPSSKIKAAVRCLVDNVLSTPGEKAVVVSQWTSVLALMEREARALHVQCATLSGAVPIPQRQDVVNKFNDKHSSLRVLLLSLCAGGVGLNLCGGSHLLLLDPHWNPQLENQAQDRIYRLGQDKPVHIYRFITRDTVEASIKQLQRKKLEVAESVLTGARPTASSKLTVDELKVLFNMHN